MISYYLVTDNNREACKKYKKKCQYWVVTATIFGRNIERLNQSFIETEIKSFKSFDLVAYCSKNPETLLLPINVPKQLQFTNVHDFIVISLCLYNACKTWVFANKTMKEL